MYERIKNLRVDKDLSQKQMGELLNCNPRTYSDYERGVLNMPVEILIRIADVHNTSIDYLLNRTDDKGFTAVKRKNYL